MEAVKTLVGAYLPDDTTKSTMAETDDGSDHSSNDGSNEKRKKNDACTTTMSRRRAFLDNDNRNGITEHDHYRREANEPILKRSGAGIDSIAAFRPIDNPSLMPDTVPSHSENPIIQPTDLRPSQPESRQQSKSQLQPQPPRPDLVYSSVQGTPPLSYSSLLSGRTTALGGLALLSSLIAPSHHDRDDGAGGCGYRDVIGGDSGGALQLVPQLGTPSSPWKKKWE